MDPVYPFFNGMNTVLKLRNHASAYISLSDHSFRLVYVKLGNQAGRIVLILIYPFNIRKKGKLFCVNCLCNSAGGIVRVNIVRLKLLVISYRENNRKEVIFQKIVKNLRIYLCDLPYKSYVFSV